MATKDEMGGKGATAKASVRVVCLKDLDETSRTVILNSLRKINDPNRKKVIYRILK